MDYIFTPATQARLNSGNLVQPAAKTGKLLPAARDPVTGEFVEAAKIFYQSRSETLSERGVIGLLAQLAGGGPYTAGSSRIRDSGAVAGGSNSSGVSKNIQNA